MEPAPNPSCLLSLFKPHAAQCRSPCSFSGTSSLQKPVSTAYIESRPSAWAMLPSVLHRRTGGAESGVSWDKGAGFCSKGGGIAAAQIPPLARLCRRPLAVRCRSTEWRASRPVGFQSAADGAEM